MAPEALMRSLKNLGGWGQVKFFYFFSVTTIVRTSALLGGHRPGLNLSPPKSRDELNQSDHEHYIKGIKQMLILEVLTNIVMGEIRECSALNYLVFFVQSWNKYITIYHKTWHLHDLKSNLIMDDYIIISFCHLVPQVWKLSKCFNFILHSSDGYVSVVMDGKQKTNNLYLWFFKFKTTNKIRPNLKQKGLW